jgi:hypothetical protein
MKLRKERYPLLLAIFLFQRKICRTGVEVKISYSYFDNATAGVTVNLNVLRLSLNKLESL